MPLSKLVFKPGINRDQTDYASEGGWYEMDKVRFRSGFPEKLGGWTVRTIEPYVGTARSIGTWSTTDGSKLIGIGTSQKMYVSTGSSVYDITPLRVTYTSTTVPSSDNCFSTTNDSVQVEILNITAGVEDGDSVTFSGVTTDIGGIPAAEFNNTFQISNVGGQCFIFLPTTATSTAVSTGNTSIVAEFDVNIGAEISVLGPGWGAGVWSRGTWGSSSITPIVISPRLQFQDNFNNDLIFNYYGGDIYYWIYDPTFTSRAVTLQSIPGAIAVPQQVSITIFTPSGHLLALGCTNYEATIESGAAMSTMTRGGAGNLTATVTTATAHGLQSGDYITVSGTIPTQFNGTFQITYIDATHFSYTMLTAPANNATTVGSYVFNNYTGAYDALLIRWANVNPDTLSPEPEVWQPTNTNTAGALRIQAGSRIVAAVNTRQETLIFSDRALTSLQFLDNADVFGLQELSANISIIGPNAVAGINNIVYWMGRDKFYTYSGRVDTLPCTIRQYIFTDINLDQGELIFAGTNNQFNEIIWFYCSANSNTIDRYVVYNYSENIWYYGQLERTAWLDSGDFSRPLALYNSWVYNQEDGVDDGQPLNATPLPIEAFIQSAFIDVDDGDKFMLIRRIIPDVNFSNSSTVYDAPEVIMTVGVTNFPGASTSTTNAEGVSTARNVITTATIDQYTNQVFVRTRGRQMNFKIESNTLGTQWQLGMPRIDARPDGMRG
jgi:hypothetical protein